MLKSLFGGITRLSLRLWWVTIALTILSLFGGIYAVTGVNVLNPLFGKPLRDPGVGMNQELLPNLEFPQTFVFTVRPGASSEDLRDLVTLPLETEVVKIPGVILAGLESTTTAPVAVLIIRNETGRSQKAIRDQITQAIEKLTAEGVPPGLKTTADLTPDLMRRVIARAPSMFKHFEAEHLLAMSPDVLAAALEANPAVLDSIDQLTKEQIAAARVDAALHGAVSREPAKLPAAWAFSDAQLPKINTFNLSSLPVLTSSVSSTDESLTPEQFREFVEKEIIAKLPTEVQDVARVSISGGQQIPKEVADAAAVAVAEARKREANTEQPTPTPTPVANTSTTNTSNSNPGGSPSTGPAQVKAPPLPASWSSLLTLVPLRAQTGLLFDANTADDLLAVKDSAGNPKTAADTLNAIAEANPALLRELAPEVIAYLRTKEADFTTNLSDAALTHATAGLIKNGAWSQLLSQPGFQAAKYLTLLDLTALKGGPADTLNALVEAAPKEFKGLAIRLAYSLTPEAIALFVRTESGFASKLSPEVLRYLSADALKTLPTGFIDGLSDAALKTDLQAIVADPSKAPGVAFETANASGDDDPNAPPLPAGWIEGLKGFGLNATQADDLLKKPFGLSAGAFINSAGGRNPRSLQELGADLFLYLAERDPNFYNDLTPATLGGLSDETLAKLPPEVQARAQRGPSFVPSTTITRADGRESLTISVQKTDAGNTVNVSDGVDAYLDKLKEERPDLKIDTIFGQAEFIKESISGVAREGGLGAVMAVIVILLFLNFSFRSTIVTAVSIPTSIAIAFVGMYWIPPAVHNWLLTPEIASALPEGLRLFLLRLFPASITLNIMTLSGLTVAVGRVVDDSIVVLENIYRNLQKADNSADRRQVVIEGTRDVSVAIFAATLTTVVVFLPIGLTGGIVGEFFLPFGLAVTYALAASFIVAITLIPLLAYIFIRRNNIPEEKEGRLEVVYHNALQWSLNHRWAVLGIATVTLIIGMVLFRTRPLTFLPNFGEPQISVAVTLPVGTKIAQTDVRVREMEAYIKELETQKRARRYQTTIGSGGGLAAFIGGGGVSENEAQITIAAETSDLNALNALTAEVRAKAESLFGERSVQVSRASLSERGFGGFALVAVGTEEKLAAANAAIKAALGTVPGLTNVTSTLDQVGGAAAILRIGQTSAVSYSGELETQDTIGVTNVALQKVRELKLDGVTITQGFQSSQQTEGFQQTFVSMGIAIVIVYIVMVLTFGSFVHPFTILFSLPLAIVGAALGLTLTDRVLGLSALIGMLMLIGIVVTNAIVMIDRVQANRKERNLGTRDALVEGARTRLRPILMTAIATIFALLPLAIGLSEGAIIAAELGTVVIGGLFSSTLLTLLVVPVIYSMIDNFQQRVTGKKK